MELFKATRQWATRPRDERFSSLTELHAACDGYRAQAATATVPFNSLRAGVRGEDVVLNGATGTQAALTHWAFGQLCQRVEAPASYLRALPAPLAADNLNHGLAQRGPDPMQLMFHRSNGSLLARAITSDRYTRIWNSDVTSRLLKLEERGPWQPAPAAMDGSRGLYASDHDLFAFLVDNGRRVFERDPNGGLSRGFFTWNSEVGAASFGLCRFLYSYVCANHIIRGASQVAEIRVRHIGDADARAWGELRAELIRYSEASASDDEAVIQRARMYSLGKDKDAVLDRLFGLRVSALTRERLEKAYLAAEVREGVYLAPPTSAWGMVNGLTELSQALPYADERTAVDRAAGRVLQLAF